MPDVEINQETFDSMRDDISILGSRITELQNILWPIKIFLEMDKHIDDKTKEKYFKFINLIDGI